MPLKRVKELFWKTEDSEHDNNKVWDSKTITVADYYQKYFPGRQYQLQYGTGYKNSTVLRLHHEAANKVPAAIALTDGVETKELSVMKRRLESVRQNAKPTKRQNDFLGAEFGLR